MPAGEPSSCRELDSNTLHAVYCALHSDVNRIYASGGVNNVLIICTEGITDRAGFDEVAPAPSMNLLPR